MRSILALCVLSFCASQLCAQNGDQVDLRDFGAPTFEEWVKLQQRRSLDYLSKNISAPETSAGSVIASPSRASPDYFFHWVRDAALAIDPLIRIFSATKEGLVKQRFFNQIQQYVFFSRKLQMTPNLSRGLGEPKFHPDGRPFEGNWGRPQNDGPAIRALGMIRFAKHLLKLGHEEFVRTQLYDSQSPSESLIKVDLDFVVQAWTQPSFDIWEEALGDHFYTRLVQRRALLEGAGLAAQLGDEESANSYRVEAEKLSLQILKHWSEESNLIIPTLNRIRGPIKTQGLDTSVILASLHAMGSDNFFNPWDDRVLASASKLMAIFHNLYPINFENELPGLGIGRYPEDSYDGVEVNKLGNPWFLTTLAVAELSYYVARHMKETGKFVVSSPNQSFLKWALPQEDFEVGQQIERGDAFFNDLQSGLLKLGDALLSRVARHTNQETGAISEQFHRETGFQQGARDLSWSYSAFLTATWARKSAQP